MTLRPTAGRPLLPIGLFAFGSFCSGMDFCIRKIHASLTEARTQNDAYLRTLWAIKHMTPLAIIANQVLRFSIIPAILLLHLVAKDE